MPRVSPEINDFLAGEVDPTLTARTDLEIYRRCAKTMLNFVPQREGVVQIRPGTKFVRSVKTVSKKTRLFAYRYSPTIVFELEFGDTYVRIYSAGSLVQDITTPYLETEVAALCICPYLDSVFLAHPNWGPRFLFRSRSGTWTLWRLALDSGAGSDLLQVRGPYQANNVYTTTGQYVTPSNTTGSVTITANHNLFSSTDVGRFIKIKNGTNVGYARITVYTSATQVTATVDSGAPFSGVGVSSDFYALQSWSVTTGYPSTVFVRDGRLCYASTAQEPNRVDLGYVGKVPSKNSGATASILDSEVFKQEDVDGTITASHAFFRLLGEETIEGIKWAKAYKKEGVLFGMQSNQTLATADGQYLAPADFDANPVTYYGSSSAQPVTFGTSLLFIDASARTLRDFGYRQEYQTYVGLDLNVWNYAITYPGLAKIAVQLRPKPFVWAITTDGKLLGLTYDGDYSKSLFGWHRHTLGGVSDAAGSAPVVEDIVAIPTVAGDADDIVLIVRRRINGATTRSVDKVQPFFDRTLHQREFYAVDCGLTSSTSKTITGITNANPAVVTSASHGYSNGDLVLLSDLLDGMGTNLNDKYFTVASAATNTFALTMPGSGTNIDSTAFGTYVSSGVVRKCVSTVSGLSHLEGQTVTVLADAGVQSSKVVSSGAITLDFPAAVVHVGLGYTADLEIPPIDAGSADGTARGKTKRVHNVGILVDRSREFKIGTNFTDKLRELTVRSSQTLFGRPPDLFSGLLNVDTGWGSEREQTLCIRQDKPLPLTIMALYPHLITQDGG